MIACGVNNDSAMEAQQFKGFASGLHRTCFTQSPLDKALNVLKTIHVTSCHYHNFLLWNIV